MSALPINPTERDRERFRDLTKAQGFYLEYDRFGNGEYKHQRTMDLFAVWWSVERERQLLQNLNQSQGCKISELLGRAEEAEAELEAVREDNHSMMLEIHNLRIERDALVAELARLRGQEPVAYVKYKQTGGNVGLSWVAIPTGAFYPNEGDPLFASPVAAVPAPIPFIPDDDTRRNDEAYAAQQAAPSVPEEWRESTKAMLLSLDEAIRADNAVYVRQSDKIVNHRHCWMRFHEKRQAVEALLQSSAVKEFLATQPGCRTCANRGQVNGLSQESYCESCVYQGRDWRQNHFVDVSKMVDAVKRRCEACAILPCSCK